LRLFFRIEVLIQKYSFRVLKITKSQIKDMVLLIEGD